MELAEGRAEREARRAGASRRRGQGRPPRRAAPWSSRKGGRSAMLCGVAPTRPRRRPRAADGGGDSGRKGPCRGRGRRVVAEGVVAARGGGGRQAASRRTVLWRAALRRVRAGDAGATAGHVPDGVAATPARGEGRMGWCRAPSGGARCSGGTRRARGREDEGTRARGGEGTRGRGRGTAPRPGRPPPGRDPLSRDAARHGTDDGGRQAGGRRRLLGGGGSGNHGGEASPPRLAGAATVPMMFAAATTSQGASLLVTSVFARLLRRRRSRRQRPKRNGHHGGSRARRSCTWRPLRRQRCPKGAASSKKIMVFILSWACRES